MSTPSLENAIKTMRHFHGRVITAAERKAVVSVLTVRFEDDDTFFIAMRAVSGERSIKTEIRLFKGMDLDASWRMLEDGVKKELDRE